MVKMKASNSSYEEMERLQLLLCAATNPCMFIGKDRSYDPLELEVIKHDIL